MPAQKNCIWLNGDAEAAADFYVSVFPNSSKGAVVRYLEGSPFPAPFAAGEVMTVDFTLDGVSYQTLNGGPEFVPNEAVSFVILTEDQEETNYYWAALTADGGQEQPCGWLKDRFGVSWQVVPEAVDRLTTSASSDPEAALRVMTAMLSMTRIDLSGIEAAYRGD